METRDKEKKPCPFCGKAACLRVSAEDGRWFVVCCLCDARGSMSNSADLALEYWNFRDGENAMSNKECGLCRAAASYLIGPDGGTRLGALCGCCAEMATNLLALASIEFSMCKPVSEHPGVISIKGVFGKPTRSETIDRFARILKELAG